MIRQRRTTLALFFVAALLSRFALADAYDPPAGYYNTATGTGTTLKQQLHDIIDNHTVLSYDSARTNLQVTDADPNQLGHMLTVYDRTSLNVAAINPNGSIPGWDSGNTWNREHTWPQSRGVLDSGPDTSDLFLLRPALTANNGDRGNLNYGGAFGHAAGVVTDGGNQMFYPGDADAGMIAREQFYLAVRYNGTEANTTDLELFAGNPSTSQGLGDLNRLIEWNYAAVPDMFERRRNQIIYDQFQHNRDPFTDRPELVWSVFVNQTNDSKVSIAGTAVNADGSSSKTIDFGRVFVNGAVPGAQLNTLNKTGNNGTYYSVTTSGAATSSVTGRFNAFRTNQVDSKSISIGLNATTTTAGIKSGTVIVDNLDVTTQGGSGKGANDANDTFNVSLAVLNHPVASFSFNLVRQTETIDFGIVPLGNGPITSGLSLTNLSASGAPTFAANLDLDAIEGTGNASAFQVGLATFTGLQQGNFVGFNPSFTPESVGQFSAIYTLHLSDEDLPGQQMQLLTLSLVGKAILAGDFNGDGSVDAGDYVVWRRSFGQSVTVAYAGADGDGNLTIDYDDYDVWRAHFGETVPGSGQSLSATVPEPAAMWLLAVGAAFVCHCLRRTRYVCEH